jgi:FtsP/CotA-like multicopper oxidase with cupredoxin domain
MNHPPGARTPLSLKEPTTMIDITTSPTVRFDLAPLMRANRISIRELAARMGVTMARVREVRAMARVPYPVACDYHQAITGVDVFSRARFDAICRQARMAG